MKILDFFTILWYNKSTEMEVIMMDSREFFGKILVKVFSADTSFDSKGWSPKNPTYGHCAVATLVIDDFCNAKDKKIAKIKVNGVSHYFNVIDGNVVDMTAEQFGLENALNYSEMEFSTREYLLSNENTLKRYKTLKKRFEDFYYDKCYSCDDCGDRHFWEDIIWITSSYGLCETCRDKLSDEEVEKLEEKYE